MSSCRKFQAKHLKEGRRKEKRICHEVWSMREEVHQEKPHSPEQESEGLESQKPSESPELVVHQQGTCPTTQIQACPEKLGADLPTHPGL